jgi:DNA-binding MarR family transcriptional regulator
MDSVSRVEVPDEIALGLPKRVSALTRLFFERMSTDVTRTESGLLHVLSERPHRITELAVREGITQPAVTQIVNRLESRGWVARSHDPGDGRAVVVSITDAGRTALDGVREEYRALMRDAMADLDADELATLAKAFRILDRLVDRVGSRTR